MLGWILVADRDAERRMLLFHLLENEGHHATVVDDGPGALTLLRDEPFDLVLVDLRLPPNGARELVGAMKRDPELRHIPVIVTTEDPDTEAITACLDAGAEDYLPKPVDPRLLRARVTASLATRRVHDLEARGAGQMRHLADAAAHIGSEAFVPADLERLSRGTDARGHLARLLLRTATRVQEREQRLRAEVASLRVQLNKAREGDA
jgi:CheY-like chemotaxis protein